MKSIKKVIEGQIKILEEVVQENRVLAGRVDISDNGCFSKMIEAEEKLTSLIRLYINIYGTE